MRIERGAEDQFRIIRDMGAEYQRRYWTLRDAVQPHMATNVRVKNDVFTSHGYDHCVRIFEQLNKMLATGFYTGPGSLSQEELFVLAVSVLLHDITMTTSPEQRRTHSVDAGKFITKEILRLSQGGLVEPPLSATEAAIVDQVMSGHSDIKDAKGKVLVHTLREIPEAPEPCHQGTVRMRVLGAVLRIGDELDCNVDRTVDCSTLVLPKHRIGNDHWRKAEIILKVTPTTTRKGVRLHLNELAIQSGNNIPRDKTLVSELVEKLQTRLKEVGGLALDELDWWKYETVEVVEPKDAKLRKVLPPGSRSAKPRTQRGQGLAVKQAQPIKEPAKNDHGAKTTTPLDQPVRIPDKPQRLGNIADDLTSWVLSDHLLKDGHFEVTPTRHVRDWIDTTKLLAERKKMAAIVTNFVNLLKQEGLVRPNVMVIGEGYPGLLLAAGIGFAAGLPVTYLVPLREKTERSEHDRETVIPKGSDVVLVTDVVTGGSTLVESLQLLATEYKVGLDRVKRILAIFRRPPAGSRKKLPAPVADRLYELNTAFPVQVCAVDPAGCIRSRADKVEIMNKVGIVAKEAAEAPIGDRR